MDKLPEASLMEIVGKAVVSIVRDAHHKQGKQEWGMNNQQPLEFPGFIEVTMDDGTAYHVKCAIDVKLKV